MKLRSYWLPWALAAMVVFGYGGAALAQAPGNTPCGAKSPPGKWKPCVSYPFRHHLTREQEMRLRHPKPGPPAAAPDLRLPPTVNVVPMSPEELRKSEEYSRTHGTTSFAPPHRNKYWGTANGRPPERYHRTTPPTPSSGGGERTAKLGPTSDLRA